MSVVDDNLAALQVAAGDAWVEPHFQFDRRTVTDAEVLECLRYDLTLEWVGDPGNGSVHLVLDADGTVELDAVFSNPQGGATVVGWEGLPEVLGDFRRVLQTWTRGELPTLAPHRELP